MSLDKSVFRNLMGKRYTRALFYEECLEDKSTVVYTLKREDHKGYPSLYRLYMEEADITEYRFATKYLDGWSHWLELSQSAFFQPYVTAWREELVTALRSEHISDILAISRDKAHSNQFYARKYLLEALEKPTGAVKRGRPTQDAIKAEITRQAASQREIDDDAKRIGLQ